MTRHGLQVALGLLGAALIAPGGVGATPLLRSRTLLETTEDLGVDALKAPAPAPKRQAQQTEQFMAQYGWDQIILRLAVRRHARATWLDLQQLLKRSRMHNARMFRMISDSLQTSPPFPPPLLCLI